MAAAFDPKSTRQLLRLSSVRSFSGQTPLQGDDDDKDAEDGLYEALNANTFNSQFTSHVIRRASTMQSAAASLATASGTLGEDTFDESRFDGENNLEDLEFDSVFAAEEMRCLALVAHNHMKPAMKTFVLANKNVLKKFRLTGTNTTMTMLREVFGDDPSVKYGPTCQSGPLGGDAELCALMCMEELGGMIFMQDPMDAHPHQADIDCLNRQANVHDVIQASNPSTAYGIMGVLRMALRSGNKGILAPFFETEYSPSVAEYKRKEYETKQAQAGKPITEWTVQSVIAQEWENSMQDFAQIDEEEPQEDTGLANKRERRSSALGSAKEALVKQKNSEKSKRNLMSRPAPIQDRVASLSESILSVQADNEDFLGSRKTQDAASIKLASRDSLLTSIDDTDFESKILPEEMRCLALMSHSHMKPAMVKFVQANKNLLKKFVLTGNDETMEILTDIYRGDPTVHYGPTCQTGPLGGDAQLCALMCLQELGGMIFFEDPMEAHPHQVDINCLNRQCNVHDIFYCNNVSSAYLMTAALRRALKIGNSDRIEPFLSTKVSPSVAEYKRRQQAVSDKMSDKNNGLAKTKSSRRGMMSKMMSVRSGGGSNKNKDKDSTSLRGFFQSKSFKKKKKKGKNKKKKGNLA